MLTWIANSPSFDTEEGIKLIEKILKVQKNPDDAFLSQLVNRLQPHSCRKTCHKNEKNNCRFDFPKAVCNETRILTEDEILNGQGKFCQLKRSEEDININNNNPDFLKIWQANMIYNQLVACMVWLTMWQNIVVNLNQLMFELA